MSLRSSHGRENPVKVLGSSALKLIRPFGWQATTDRGCAKREKSSSSVTCGQGGSGSKSDPSSLLPTPCCHHFELFAHQVTSPKFLAAQQSSTGFLSCGKSMPCHWPCQWAQPAERSSLWRHAGCEGQSRAVPSRGDHFLFLCQNWDPYLVVWMLKPLL